MITSHNLLQGSAPWHAFRAEHFGASEASAMLGLSPYKTRTQLLNEKKTGLTADVDAFTQKIFDKGHAVEALARPIVEKMIGEELSPMTFSNGKLSASCDGINFEGNVAWENKQFNAAHYEQVKNGELPEIHWPQCQQVLYCTGAEKLFFTVSDGTEDRTAGVWVYPNRVQEQHIVEGWNQFETDLASHEPPVMVERVEAETVQTLPVPSVVVRGEITASNLNEITPKFDAYLGGIKTELSTDQDFADAEANAKNCRETAKRIQALRANIIAQMVEVNTVDSALANYEEAFNKVGLRLEKAVKDQKETLKTNAIMKAKVEYADYVTELNKDIPIMLSHKLVCPDFAGVIKGVKTIESMQSRINDALANGKTEATVYANDVKTKVAFINEAIKGYEHLINLRLLATENLDYIKLHIQSVKDAEDKRNAERDAEIKAQAEADAKAKLEAEAKAKADQLASADKPILGQPDMSAGVGRLGSENTMINEADFSKHVGVVEVKTKDEIREMLNTKTSVPRPAMNEIVSLVSRSYGVDYETGYNWLVEHFTDRQKAA